ncbi:MAG: hypothetical protein PVG65_06065 [Candidatus Thorarchaeota archaeon]|jgi:small subunit ribosomal protein S4e
MYVKRQKIPKTWPLSRKGTKYLAVPKHNLKKGIPLVIILRDILKLVGTNKEAKKILNMNKVKVNHKVIRKERYPLTLFDVLSLDDKNFKLVLEKKKFGIVEAKGKDAEEKIIKVIGKKTVKKGALQVNLSDGRNYVIKENVKVGDSAVLNLKENKISEILPFKEGAKIIFITGKHIGEKGTIENIDEKKKIIELKVDSEKINGKRESLLVIK